MTLEAATQAEKHKRPKTPRNAEECPLDFTAQAKVIANLLPSVREGAHLNLLETRRIGDDVDLFHTPALDRDAQDP